MFSIKLKELREKAGFSQQALANKIGVSQSTIGMWESGKREPNFETTSKLADFFNCSTDYLLGKSDVPTSLDEQLANEEFALYGEVHDLTDEEKQRVLDFIKFTKSQRKNV